MLPSGPSNPIGGAQSLTRSNSALPGTGQQNPNPNPQQFSSLVPSSRAQFSNNSNHMNMLVNNIPNVSSLISNQSTSNALEPNSSISPVEAMQNYQQQQVLRNAMGNASNLAPMKSEPQFDPQQLQAIRNLAPVKLEPNSADPSVYFHQQQQQRIIQQRLIQLQHHQNQHLPHNKGLPPRSQLQNQQLQQSQQLQQGQQLPQNQQLQQNAQLRTQSKPNNYEPGVCPRRLTQYMYQQQKRPQDNNIGFWRSFVKEFFAPNAKKRWCVSQYGTGRHTTGVFPQDVWNCEICNQKPGRGFETTAEVLPRLCQIKYASGTLEELLYIDMPRESHNAMGQIVLDYPKAIQESVFEQLRVIRDGHLRIIFNPDLKIASWEFCARKHDELIPRRLLIPQVKQLGAVVQKYQNSVQNGSSPLSSQDLQSNCNGFVASARQVAKALEVPLVNDLGYTKRYVRCLQISEVVNSMKDLIDYSRQTGTGPMESLINFPRRNSISSQAQQQSEQQQRHQNQNQNQTNMQDTSNHNNIITSENIMQLASNGVTTANSYPSSNSNPMATATTNSQQDNQNGHSNGPYGGANSNNMPQMPPTSSTGSLCAQAQNPSSRILHASNHNVGNQQPNCQSSVNKILGMVSQMNNAGGTNGNFTGNEMKGNNGISSAMNVGMSFGNMNGLGPSATTINTNNINGQRVAMMNNAMGMNGMAMNHHLSRINHQIQQQQQQDIGSRLMNNLGFNNSYNNNNHFDWKE